MKKLSIIIPVFNEVKTVKELLLKVEAVDFSPVEKEIIIVDDGSTDGTRELLKTLENKYRVIYHEKNLGKGAGLKTGFLAASGDYVVVQDADLEYDPEDIKKLVEVANTGAEVVYGSRLLNRRESKNPKAGWFYYLGGISITLITDLLYGINITDEPVCYKMCKKEVLDSLKLEGDGFELEPEMTAKIAKKKIKIHEVPISYYPRSKKGGKKIKFKDAVLAAWTLLKYRFK